MKVFENDTIAVHEKSARKSIVVFNGTKKTRLAVYKSKIDGSLCLWMNLSAFPIYENTDLVRVSEVVTAYVPTNWKPSEEDARVILSVIG